MMATWSDLDAELDAWGEEGRTATMWLRDDDAVTATAALEGLLESCAAHRVPAALAVIPEPADEALAAVVRGSAGVHVLQHGWRHANHAPPQAKKCELGDHREPSEVRAELEQGRRRLEQLFEARFLPVLAPPWNRIGEGVVGRLRDWGYHGLSVFTPRDRTATAPGLVRINTHVDLIDWKGTRGFRGDADVLAQAVSHLKARRTGAADADEPTGLVTHHLVHDAACRDFIDAWLARTCRHQAVAWPAVGQLFGLA